MLIVIGIIFFAFCIGGGNKNNIQKEETPVVEAPVNNLVSTPVLTEKEKSQNRKELETILRNAFLDDGQDIKVKVSGKNNTIITLSYCLYNAVWTRDYEKNGIISSFEKKGFKKLIMTDDYDYKVSFNFDK